MNSRGFSLIEALIVLLISSLGMYGIMHMSSVGFKAQKGVEHSAELNLLGSTLQMLLLPKDPCELNLVDLHFDPSASKEDPTGTGGPSFLQATDMELKWPTSGATPTIFLKAPTSANPSPDRPYYHYGGWNLNPSLTPAHATVPAGLGLRLIGPAGAGRYLVSVEVNLTKPTGADGTPVSLGASTGKRQGVTVVVSASGSATDVTISGCGTTSGLTFHPIEPPVVVLSDPASAPGNITLPGFPTAALPGDVYAHLSPVIQYESQANTITYVAMVVNGQGIVAHQSSPATAPGSKTNGTIQTNNAMVRVAGSTVPYLLSNPNSALITHQVLVLHGYSY
jgi:hypothetical protein